MPYMRSDPALHSQWLNTRWRGKGKACCNCDYRGRKVFVLRTVASVFWRGAVVLHLIWWSVGPALDQSWHGVVVLPCSVPLELPAPGWGRTLQSRRWYCHSRRDFQPVWYLGLYFVTSCMLKKVLVNVSFKQNWDPGGARARKVVWSKTVWGGTVPVAPKTDVSMSLWGIFCLQQRSALCPAGHLLWAGAGLSLRCMVDISCTGVFEMNVLISYILKNIYEIWGSEWWGTEVVECWCQQFLLVCSSWGWLCLFLVEAHSFALF